MAGQSSEKSKNLDPLIAEGSDLYKTLKAHYSKNDQTVVRLTRALILIYRYVNNIIIKINLKKYNGQTASVTDGNRKKL